jgi:bifunctional non-homologous end joining protein LigD
MPRQETIIDVEGRRLSLSNLDKVLYPETGFTKRQVIDYYVRVAPFLLPHLAGRPLTMKRYPSGVAGMFFYEKNCPRHRPEWVETAPIWSEGNHRWMDYCVAQNLSTLVWAANLAALELHTSLSMASAMAHPSYIIFDLDPGEPANMVECCKVALWVRDGFARAKLRSFAKTSGSKGLQVYVPLHSGVGYSETKPFAHELARTLERKHPELVVSDMKRELRGGKVLVDWSQNDVHKTTVSVYSLRARPLPTVSTPVSWAEVGRCLESGNAAMLAFTAPQVLERVDRLGDLFASALSLHQQLPAVVEVETSPRAAVARAETATGALPAAHEAADGAAASASARVKAKAARKPVPMKAAPAAETIKPKIKPKTASAARRRTTAERSRRSA